MNVLFEGKEYDGFLATYPCSHAEILTCGYRGPLEVTLRRGLDYFDVGACRITETEDSYEIRRAWPEEVRENE